MERLLLTIVLIVAYVFIFNKIAKAYFETNGKMTWSDVYREFMPPLKIHIEL